MEAELFRRALPVLELPLRHKLPRANATSKRRRFPTNHDHELLSTYTLLRAPRHIPSFPVVALCGIPVGCRCCSMASQQCLRRSIYALPLPWQDSLLLRCNAKISQAPRPSLSHTRNFHVQNRPGPAIITGTRSRCFLSAFQTLSSKPTVAKIRVNRGHLPLIQSRLYGMCIRP